MLRKKAPLKMLLQIYFLGYVDAMKALLFTLPKSEMREVLERYSGKVPKSFNQQFPARRSKQEAVEVYQTRRKMKRTSLFPSMLEFNRIHCYFNK